MIPRIRFVVDTDPVVLCRWSTPEETARLIQSILRKQLGVPDLDVTVDPGEES